MTAEEKRHTDNYEEGTPRNATGKSERILIFALVLLLLIPMDWFSARANASAAAQAPQPDPLASDSAVYLDAELAVPVPGREAIPMDSLATDSIGPTVVTADDYTVSGKIPFNPSPERAVWLSALCPGLGQIYNRRYWKLPIVIGGFMGLGYATNWNNSQYQDYMQGYRDILDNDPDTKSYMNFFPPTVKEEDLDRSWVEQTFKNRKDYFRRNRDLCIISMVGVYALAIVDAYVDASLSHFDVSPDLSINVAPTILPDINGNRPAFGVLWALNF